MIRSLVGLALLPTAALVTLAALKCVALLAARCPAAAPFAAGMALSTALWLVARAAESERGPAGWVWALSSRVYVFGHELTHALAAWSMGGKVHGFHVGETGGHVDLSESNAFIALAPYCLPLYTAGVVGAWRLLLWLRPEAADGSGPALFLVLVGGTLAFHVLQTLGALSHKQPDVKAAGGALFSLTTIALANGLCILLLAKALFPKSVHLATELASVAAASGRFWLTLWAWAKPWETRALARLRAL